MKSKLDLDYLQSLDIQSKEEEDLRIVLRFDLVRLDCQCREYKFAEQDQFDSFVDIIQPIFVKNRQKRLSEMKYCEVSIVYMKSVFPILEIVFTYYFEYI